MSDWVIAEGVQVMRRRDDGKCSVNGLVTVTHISSIHVIYKIRTIMATFILKSTHTTRRGFLGHI